MAMVLMLNGSAHENGNTAEALNEMAAVFKDEGIETKVFQIGNQAIYGCADCGYCEENGKCTFENDAVNEVAALLEKADGLIVASPEYFNSPSGTVLAFLDRLFRSARFDMGMKVGAGIVTGDSSDPAGSIDTLNQYFAIGGMKIASISFWGQNSDNNPDKKEPFWQVRQLARDVSSMIKALTAVTENGEEPDTDIEDMYKTDYTDGDFEQIIKRPTSVFILDEENPVFPDPRYASPTGLLAVGGGLSVEWLIAAYRKGIFPWTEEGLPMMWFCPKERFVLRPSDIHLSKRMAKFMRNHTVTLEVNRDFADAMHHCRAVREEKGEETWITDEVEELYLELWKAGYGYCAEAYIDGELAGGEYGIRIGKCLIAESAFSMLPDGSKMCMYLLAKKMEEDGDLLFDAQVYSEYLARMGFKSISYDEYVEIMNRGLQNS